MECINIITKSISEIGREIGNPRILQRLRFVENVRINEKMILNKGSSKDYEIFKKHS